MSGKFVGFTPATIRFLQELRENNNREWFQENKPRYESDVLFPALDFVQAMQAPLAKISEHFSAVPKRVGGSVMRVYRDTRFSKDKTPYKTNLGIQFRHELGKDVHAPGYYFHVSPDEVFIAAGIWHPDSPSLAAVREAMVEEGAAWKRATRGRAFTGVFELAGDSLKRPPRGFDAGHPLIDDLKRKDFIAVAELSPKAIEGPNAPKELAKMYRAATPMMRFLCRALQVPF